MYWVIGGLITHLGIALMVFLVSVLVLFDFPEKYKKPELMGAALIWEITLPIAGMYCVFLFVKAVIKWALYKNKED